MNDTGLHALFIKGTKKLFFYLFFAVFFISCSPVKHIARQFISSNHPINILLLKPDYVFKKNFKIDTDTLPEEIKDSVGISQSLLLRKVNDNTVIDLLFSGLTDELRNRKLKIYTEENMNEFMKLDSGAFIFNIVQSELDEYSTPYTVSQVYDTLTYYKNFELNAVSINIWYEASQLNTQDKITLLYSSDSINDDIEGHFKKLFLSNEIKYIYKRKEISTDDLYNKIADIATTDAGYIYDYILNKYLNEKYIGGKFLKYYHYDKQKDIIYPAKYKRFIFM